MATNLTESDFEGYLEKHGTGTVSRILGKQKKTWCFLKGAWLYCHQSNNKRSSVVSSIDLTEAQMIRKNNTDKTALQFEIVTKFKNICFTASTVEECNAWIKHLQKAMTLKDFSSQNLPIQTRKSFPHEYEDIDEDQNKRSVIKQQQLSLSHYEDIDQFQQNSGFTKANTVSSHYASIDDDDVFTQQNNSSPYPSRCEPSKDISNISSDKSSTVEYSTVVPKNLRNKAEKVTTDKNTPKQFVSSKPNTATSSLNNRCTTETKPDLAELNTTQTTEGTQRNLAKTMPSPSKDDRQTSAEDKTLPRNDELISGQAKTELMEGGSTVILSNMNSEQENVSTTHNLSECKTKQAKCTIKKAEDTLQTRGENGLSSDSEEESIDDIVSMIPKSFPALTHKQNSLNEEDSKPISDLIDFLHNNISVISFPKITSRKSDDTDPVEKLKAYLNSLDL